MNRIIITLVLVCSIQPAFSQDLGEMFEEEMYTYHLGVDSIISTKYMLMNMLTTSQTLIIVTMVKI